LSVVIGDINDNRMRDGWKKVTLFYIENSQKLIHTQNKRPKSTPIGRINVDDDDDWDINDKKFYWFSQKSDSNFEMDSKTEMISMKNVSKGNYELKFRVFDRTHKQEVHSNVWIHVNEIEYESVFN
jgi:dynein heavy chain 2